MALYLVPIYLVYLCVFILPVILAIYFSFFNFRTVSSKTFVGLFNYKKLFTDPLLLSSLKNNLYLVLVCMIGQIGIAFVFANMLYSRLINPKVSNFFRTVIYFPVTLSAVIIGYVWTMIYDYHFGLLNQLLISFGFPDAVKAWLTDERSIMTVVSIPMIWQYVGFHLVIIMAAMTSIDKEVYEMAEIDGASGFRKAVSITFPLIKNTLSVCVLLCVSANMKAFDHILAMTNGGPGYSSSVLALYAYKISFAENNLGYGNTVSVAIMVVMVIIIAGAKGIMSLFKSKE
ncbi:MAG: sugar ABC transporter permease [Clostridiaceae bacterium]|nr:sugar ABC transporter permease [Clostridiaceae bacterium]